MEESFLVLYVEDAKESYIAVSTYMNDLGHRMLPRLIDLEEARKCIEQDRPDVLILDLDLRRPPETDPVDRMRKTAEFAVDNRARYPHMVILVHSHLEKVRPDILRMLLANGISYMVKEGIDGPEDLARVIALARTGGAAYDAHVVRFLPEILAEKSNGALTPRQWDVVALCRDKTDAEIGAYLGISEKRTSELLSEARGRLGLKSKTDLALWYSEQVRNGTASPPPERKKRA